MPRTDYIEKTVYELEGFEIIITQNGVNVRGDKFIPRQYDAAKMSKKSFTVREWQEKFQCQFPGYEALVLYEDGSIARGNTLLSTVRDSYRQ